MARGWVEGSEVWEGCMIEEGGGGRGRREEADVWSLVSTPVLYLTPSRCIEL